MSRSEGREFERWIASRFNESNGFTALVMLLATANGSIAPLSSSFVHVVGTEVPWTGMKGMLDQSGRKWDAVIMFAEHAPGGGPLLDIIARARMQQRIDDLSTNPRVLDEGRVFDRKGRAIRLVFEDA